MVALTDEDPQVRKIASRILKVMGVKNEAQIPDAKKELPAPEPSKPAAEQWKEEKKLEATEVPPPSKELTTPPANPVGGSKWADLENMKQGQTNNYDDMKEQLEMEKKGQVTLDAAELKADSDSYTTPLSSVVQSLKDLDPWVRASRLPAVSPWSTRRRSKRFPPLSRHA